VLLLLLENDYYYYITFADAQIQASPIYDKIPDISLSTVKFPDISGFSSEVVTTGNEHAHKQDGE